MKTKHTDYIVMDDKGELTAIKYAPDQNYSGQRASDSYSLAQGLFIDGISHDLWIGPISAHRVLGTHSGLETINGINVQIIAKAQYDWDMSLPLGERRINVKETSNFHNLLKSLRA